MSASVRNKDLYRRIFIIGGKGNTEDEFKDAFAKYGDILDIYIVKDKTTSEPKGIVYITYSKVSQALLAIDRMHGQCMPNQSRSLRVVMASDRDEGNSKEDRMEDQLKRIFIVVPKTSTEDEIKDQFAEFGHVESVKVLKDRTTDEPKGLAYVKYRYAYDAAIALETCSHSFKPMWASSNRTQGSKRPLEGSHYSSYGDYERAPRASYRTASCANEFELSPSRISSRSDDCYLEVLASCDQGQLQRLFDLVPGMEYCDFDRNTNAFYVKYVSSKCAIYARDKLNGFEYPTGCRISIRYPPGAPSNPLPASSRGLDSSSLPSGLHELNQSLQSLTQAGSISCNLQQLASSIQKATALLSSAGIHLGDVPLVGNSSGMPTNDLVRVNYCNFTVPERKPLADRNSAVACRLFIVSKPHSFPETVLQDLLCRFGGLITAFFMRDKNFGYAKFASQEGAQAAIDLLNGQQVSGMMLKVMVAEAPKDKGDGSSYAD